MMRPSDANWVRHMGPNQFAALTISIHWLLTKTKRGAAGQQVTETTIWAIYAHSGNVDFIGIKEPHLSYNKNNFRDASAIFNDSMTWCPSFSMRDEVVRQLRSIIGGPLYPVLPWVCTTCVLQARILNHKQCS